MKVHGTEQFPHLGSLTLPVLSNHINPETPNRQCGWPWMPISGDGKLHLTHFCNRSIIMQTAVGHCQTCSKAWKIESQARLTPGQLAFPKNASELLPLAYA